LPQQMTDGPPPGLPHPGSPQPPEGRGTPPPPGRRLAGGPLRTAVRHRRRGSCPTHAVMQRVARAGEANARRRRAGGRPRRAWRARVHHGPASSLHRVRAEMRRGHTGRAKGGRSLSYAGGSPARQLAAPSTAGNAPTVGARRGPIQRGPQLRAKVKRAFSSDWLLHFMLWYWVALVWYPVFRVARMAYNHRILRRL